MRICGDLIGCHADRVAVDCTDVDSLIESSRNKCCGVALGGESYRVEEHPVACGEPE